MALPMTLIIIAGEIDLSVESMAGLSSARSSASSWPPASRSRSASPIVLVRRGPRRPVQRPPRHPASACRRSSSRWARSPCSAASPWSSWDRRASATSPTGSPTFGFGTVPGHAHPVAAPGLRRPGDRARRRPPRDVDRAPDLRHRQERRGLALLGGPGRARQAGPVRPVGHGGGARRGHPDGTLRQRPRRRRPGPDADRRHDRAARRGQHLRWSRHHPGRRPRRSDRWRCSATSSG